MKVLPKLALVGRPNVGKSALFNRICRKKKAIVDEAEGVTRDRLYDQGELFGFHFEVIDTGGIQFDDTLDFNSLIRAQSEIAIEEADTIVMVVDAHIGPTALDKQVAQKLLKQKKPVCLAVNKVDDNSHENLVHQFYELGIKHMIPVSAVQGLNMAELLEAAWKDFPKNQQAPEKSKRISVALVGRTNVGKSTLLNTLVQDQRSLVSPIAGTTRDCIDIELTVDDTEYTFVDTAGIRRKKAEHEVVDKFAFIRTKKAIERADLCLLVLDAQEGLTKQEKRILGAVEEAGKACLILINKWDLIKGHRMEHCLKAIEAHAPYLKGNPALFISAQEGRNVEKIFPRLKDLYEAYTKRVSTGMINKHVQQWMQLTPPPRIQGKRLRIYFMTQAQTCPPTFVMFINYKRLFDRSYLRYLCNNFRKTFGFSGVPFKVLLKEKKNIPVQERLEAKNHPHFSSYHQEEEKEDFESAEIF